MTDVELTALLTRAKNQDGKAVDKLFDWVYSVLRGKASESKLNNYLTSLHIEDIIQVAAIRIAEQLRDNDPPTFINVAYISKQWRWTALDYIKKIARQKQVCEDMFEYARLKRGNRPDYRMVKEEVCKLEPKDRLIIRSRFFGRKQLSKTEVAAATGVHRNTVANREQRYLPRLRWRLKDRGFERVSADERI